MKHSTFINSSAVAAEDLKEILGACRQLRHVPTGQIDAIVMFFFGDIQHSLREGKRLPSTGRFFVMAQQAFEEAFSVHGASCDICGIVSDVPEDWWRRVATRALDNLDGYVKLMLCETCSSRFGRFCSKHFERESRVPWSRDLEQMMLAFVASEVGIEARRIMAGRPPRKRGNANTQPGAGSSDRSVGAPGLDHSRDLTIDWNSQRDGQKVQVGL